VHAHTRTLVYISYKEYHFIKHAYELSEQLFYKYYCNLNLCVYSFTTNVAGIYGQDVCND
jgi:hypothetical protein